MIRTKAELKRVLNFEKEIYLSNNWRSVLVKRITKSHDYLLWKYQRSLRYTEFYFNTKNMIKFYYWETKKNKMGAFLGITMWHNCFDEGLRIWHYGNIIVHADARIGKNCQLHGDNCIGNKGTSKSGVPIIGDNVDIGVGAKLIGNICIANNVRVGANAVVTSSCNSEGAILVGIPAKML